MKGLNKLKYNDVIDRLQNLTMSKINTKELADVLGMPVRTLYTRSYRNSEVTPIEIKKIEDFYRVNLFKHDSNITISLSDEKISCAAKINDVIKIPYWEGLPDELKHIEYTYVLAQRASIEQGWNLSPENLCITVMNGDAMENYWYKIRNNDVLIIDTSETKVNANGCGVYFATSRNNSMFWIREMQMLYNGDIEFHSYSPSGTKAKVLTQEQLKDTDFKIIGKVIKNVSFRL